MILHSSQIRKNIARLKCSSGVATAFLVSPKIALTALHAVEEEKELITLEFFNLGESKKTVKARRISNEEDVDVAILQLDEEVIIDEYLAITSSLIPHDFPWETYGYPIMNGGHESRVTGDVSKVDEAYNPKNWDVDLSRNVNIEDFRGLSGAPLIVSGEIRGIILVQSQNSLGAISVNKFVELLNEYNITYSNEVDDSLPKELKESTNKVISNFDTLDQIENKIKEVGSGIILLTGSPGSGKTTTSAMISPLGDDISICGRYFVNIPNDKYPVAYRASEENFARWLESCITKILYKSVPPQRDYNANVFIKIVNEYFDKLSIDLVKQGKIGVFIIDGIDDVANLGVENINRFLSLLPNKIPNNIVILLSCISKEILPTFIQEKIDEDNNHIAMESLELQTCEAYIYNELEEYCLDYLTINKLASRSMGHPLYLNYIIKYIKQNATKENVLEYLDDIPAFEGDIKKYYERIWLNIYDDPHKVNFLATVSRLRMSINKELLYKIQLQNTQYNYTDVFNKLRYLLIGGDEISIYHSSFADFINEKTAHLNSEIHSRIGNACKLNKEIDYALINMIYHLSNGVTNDVEQSIKLCDQEWADSLAVINTSPDLILLDIKNILKITVTKGIVKDTIRLLLLSQRLSFRYNDVFARNAATIAKIQISQSKIQESINYILRENILIISNEDAFFCLQKFYELENFKEAKMLSNAIKERCMHQMKNNKATIGTFINIIKIDMMYINEDLETSTLMYKRNMKRIKGIIEEVHTEEECNLILNELTAIYVGYFLWNYDLYAPLKEQKKLGINIDENITYILAKTVLNYKYFEELFQDNRISNKIQELILDLENLVDKCIGSNFLIYVEALMPESKRSDLIRRLISNIDMKSNGNIRESNGVDPNWSFIDDLIREYKYKAYSEDDCSYPLVQNLDEENWEEYIISLIKYVGYLEGKGYLFKSKEDKDFLDKSVDKVIYAIDKLIFDYNKRVHFKRSYALPELILPYLYNRIFRYIVEFIPDKIDIIIQIIIDNREKNLGLHVEGYSQVLKNVIEVLLKFEKYKRKSFKLVRELEEHVKLRVLNRWERTKYLLCIVDFYSRIGSNERANNVYQDMLDTSMGPSWYKEDQLSLINSAFSNLNSIDINKVHLKNVLEQLEYASGEMTFQRYVRVAKEEFMGYLCKNNMVYEAISYFKEQACPEFEIIIENVRNGSLDEHGNGYINGAKVIDEQNAILEIIENTNNLSNCIKWAISEVFILGDRRYLSRFSIIQSEILNDLESISSHNYKSIFKRCIRQLVVEFDEKYRDEYLSLMKKYLTSSNYKFILRELKKLNIYKTSYDHTVKENLVYNSESMNNEESDEEKEGLYLKGTFGKKEALLELDRLIKQAYEELEIDNRKKAKELIVSGIKSVQKGGWDIWSGNTSKSLTEAIELLIELSQDQGDILKSLGQLIVDEDYAHHWRMANNIINLIGPNCDNTLNNNIFEVVMQHIQYLVRGDNNETDKFKWILGEYNNVEENKQIVELILWLTNYPNTIIKYKAIEILRWLTLVEQDNIITILIEKSIEENINYDSYVSVAVLSSLAIDSPRAMKFDVINRYKDSILKVEDFTILTTYQEILENIKTSQDNEEIDKFSNSLKNMIIRDVQEVSGMDIEDIPEKINSIEYEITELSKYMTIDNEFIKNILNEVNNLCSPLDFKDVQNIDRYINRSFSLNKDNVNYQRQLCIFALNREVLNKINSRNHKEVIKVLRMHNPYFPHYNIDIQPENTSEFVQALFNDTINQWDINRCFKDNDNNYILHYHEFFFKERSLEEIEVTGFIIESKNKSGIFEFNKSFDYIGSNNYLNEYKVGRYEEKNTTIEFTEPAVIKVDLSHVIGGSFTPSFIHPSFVKKVGDIGENKFKRKNWISGRNLSVNAFGIPLAEGCCLSISSDILQNIDPKYKIVWLLKYNDEYIFLDEKTGQIIR